MRACVYARLSVYVPSEHHFIARLDWGPFLWARAVTIDRHLLCNIWCVHVCLRPWGSVRTCRRAVLLILCVHNRPSPACLPAWPMLMDKPWKCFSLFLYLSARWHNPTIRSSWLPPHLPYHRSYQSTEKDVWCIERMATVKTLHHNFKRTKVHHLVWFMGVNQSDYRRVYGYGASVVMERVKQTPEWPGARVVASSCTHHDFAILHDDFLRRLGIDLQGHKITFRWNSAKCTSGRPRRPMTFSLVLHKIKISFYASFASFVKRAGRSKIWDALGRRHPIFSS